jgi:hypothetical protein
MTYSDDIMDKLEKEDAKYWKGNCYLCGLNRKECQKLINAGKSCFTRLSPEWKAKEVTQKT